MSNWKFVSALLLLFVFTSATASVAQCDDWHTLGDGFNSSVMDLATWDPDGPGPDTPRLVATGYFSQAGGIHADSVAAWDGEAWTGIGPDFVGPGPAVVTTWDPDGPGPVAPRLVVGGYFFDNDDNWEPRSVAIWNGSTWEPPGTGVSLSVTALCSWDADGDGPLNPDLFVGGTFTFAGGKRANAIARWDGSDWHALGTGMRRDDGFAPIVSSLLSFDPDGAGPQAPLLIAGGDFTTAGGVAANRIAKWDGTAWHPLGLGLGNGAVLALAAWDADGLGPLAPYVVAGGTFTQAEGVSTNGVAYWDGESWSPLGTGLGSVHTLAAWQTAPNEVPRLVAGGQFGYVGDLMLNFVAQWSGSQWEPLGLGASAYVHELLPWDVDGPGPTPPVLVAGGSFTTAGSAIANHIAAWTPCPPACPGDTDCDGFVTLADIDPFIAHLGCPSPDVAACDTGCPWHNADVNADDSVTFADIDPFVARLGATCE